MELDYKLAATMQTYHRTCQDKENMEKLLKSKNILRKRNWFIRGYRSVKESLKDMLMEKFLGDPKIFAQTPREDNLKACSAVRRLCHEKKNGTSALSKVQS